MILFCGVLLVTVFGSFKCLSLLFFLVHRVLLLITHRVLLLMILKNRLLLLISHKVFLLIPQRLFLFITHRVLLLITHRVFPLITHSVLLLITHRVLLYLLHIVTNFNLKYSILAQCWSHLIFSLFRVLYWYWYHSAFQKFFYLIPHSYLNFTVVASVFPLVILNTSTSLFFFKFAHNLILSTRLKSIVSYSLCVQICWMRNYTRQRVRRFSSLAMEYKY